MKTSLYAILCIVIRLGAVFLALDTVTTLPATMEFLGGLEGGSASLPWKSLAITGGILLLSALLWLYPGQLARLATDRSSQQVFESPIDARDLHWIALSLVGVYFVLIGLIDTIGWLTQIWVISAQFEVGTFQMMRLPASVLGGLIASMLEFGAGCLLTLGSRGLVRLLHTLRYGSPAPARPTEEAS